MSLIDSNGCKRVGIEEFRTQVLQRVEKVVGINVGGHDEQRMSQILDNVRNSFEYQHHSTEISDEESEENNEFMSLSTLVDQTIQGLIHISDKKICSRQHKLRMRMERGENKGVNNDERTSLVQSNEDDSELQNVKRRVYRMTVKKMKEVIKNANIPIKKRSFSLLSTPI